MPNDGGPIQNKGRMTLDRWDGERPEDQHRGLLLLAMQDPGSNKNAMSMADGRNMNRVIDCFKGAMGRAAVAPPGLQRTFASLHDPSFRWFFLSTLGMMGAVMMQILVRGFLVFDLTGSFAALGVLAISSAIPQLLVGFYGVDSVLPALPSPDLFSKFADALEFSFRQAVLPFDALRVNPAVLKAYAFNPGGTGWLKLWGSLLTVFEVPALLLLILAVRWRYRR